MPHISIAQYMLVSPCSRNTGLKDVGTSSFWAGVKKVGWLFPFGLFVPRGCVVEVHRRQSQVAYRAAYIVEVALLKEQTERGIYEHWSRRSFENYRPLLRSLIARRIVALTWLISEYG
jgi:hypothetical protein